MKPVRVCGWEFCISASPQCTVDSSMCKIDAELYYLTVAELCICAVTLIQTMAFEIAGNTICDGKKHCAAFFTGP